ncbi:myosuppressin isoform X1 [Vespula squamosa]|uniref:Myosuppressin isoform X1 n=1 Tax=Vespula squamosa TaxID=30214 RepID=A0ABD1ZWP0_VESSQ
MFECVRLITLSSHSTYHSDQKCDRKTKEKNAQLGNLTIGLVIEYSQGTYFPRLLDIACKDNAKKKYWRIRARTPVLLTRRLSSFTEIMNSMIKIVVSLVALSILFGEICAMPPAQCSPGFLDEVPPKVQKICAALSTIYQIQSAMESYVDDKVSVLQENNPLPGSGVKRQDVDHVFLRFGRRR